MKFYSCRAHPEVRYLGPGKCQACGNRLEFDMPMGVFAALMISLGSVISAATLIVSSVPSGTLGSVIVLSVLFATVLAVLGGLSLFEISKFIGKEGGVYEYTREMFGPNAGFIAGTLRVAGMLTCAAAAALILGGDINSIFQTPYTTPFLALFEMVGVLVLAAIGFRLSIRMLTFLVIVNVLGLGMLLLFGADLFNYIQTPAILPFNLDIFRSMLAATAIIFFGLSGFSGLTAVKSSFKDYSTIAQANYLSMIFYFFFYAALVLVFAGVAGATKVATITSPLIIGMYILKGKGLFVEFEALRIMGLLGLILICFISAGRTLYTMGRDRDLPHIFSKLDRGGKPASGIALGFLISMVLVFLVPQSVLVETAGATMLAAFTLLEGATLNMALKHRRNAQARGTLITRDWFAVIPTLGILGSLSVLAGIGTGGLSLGFGIVLLAGFYYNYGRVLLMRMKDITQMKESPKFSEVREFVR